MRHHEEQTRWAEGRSGPLSSDTSVVFATAVRILARLNRLADEVSPFDRPLVENAKDDIITIMKGE